MLIDTLVDTKSNTAVCLFAGWGMDARPFIPLIPQGLTSDLLLMRSYHEKNALEGETFARLLRRYERIAVVGWSFGVAIAWGLIRCAPAVIASFTAVNGTPCPIDAQYGIDPRIMRRTIARFGEDGREAFYRNMCGSARNCFSDPDRSTADLAAELTYLQKRFEGTQACELTGTFQKVPLRAFVSLQDRIIPAKSQIAAWEKWKVPCQCIQGSHYNATLVMDVLQQAASDVQPLTL